jgi:hypothetical protein
LYRRSILRILSIRIEHECSLDFSEICRKISRSMYTDMNLHMEILSILTKHENYRMTMLDRSHHDLVTQYQYMRSPVLSRSFYIRKNLLTISAEMHYLWQEVPEQGRHQQY